MNLLRKQPQRNVPDNCRSFRDLANRDTNTHPERVASFPNGGRSPDDETLAGFGDFPVLTRGRHCCANPRLRDGTALRFGSARRLVLPARSRGKGSLDWRPCSVSHRRVNDDGNYRFTLRTRLSRGITGVQLAGGPPYLAKSGPGIRTFHHRRRARAHYDSVPCIPQPPLPAVTLSPPPLLLLLRLLLTLRLPPLLLPLPGPSRSIPCPTRRMHWSLTLTR